MGVQAIVGAQWGDEGKGKMTDLLAENADWIVRYQGGSNAGHTIMNEYGKFALHMLPSGVFHPGKSNVIGPGAALDADSLLAELDELERRGVPKPKLYISDRAQLVLPVHRLLDRLEEERLGGRSFGSTRKGIAPFYADKYAKLGLQVSELLDETRLAERLERLMEPKRVLLEHLYGQPAPDLSGMAAELLETGRRLAPFLADTTALLQHALRRGERILAEGQLGALRDPDHGIYPFSTSSSTLAGYAPVGAGVPAREITEVLAVVKVYSSCVGAGPFVSELHDAEAEELRRRGGSGGEYGATTGRPRRMGWFDVTAARYGCQVQGATGIALTNLDVLGYLDEIPVCVQYEIDGERTDEFPVTGRLQRAKPVLTNLPGWRCDISRARTLADLPREARSYVELVEQALGVPVQYVSVGPERGQTIFCHR
ncbi:adenylosuccinate synthase [Paenibacillus pasadenensis]|uniref:adenylosuccinate synthase n=1 Tax=Paenibacillus pasadenensis TaxID=217090 RepID=UPI00204239B8|nr:adenylosuccinate synthase [Paenibacillus pasadenensis]MCM3746101.1 adenylosuccinate synthase [Paenibacillus pasadenensis]